MSYLGKVFENLTNSLIFSKIKKFPVFPGFHSEQSFQLGSILTCFIGECFLKLLIIFFVWKNFFRYHFPSFPAFPSNQPGLFLVAVVCCILSICYYIRYDFYEVLLITLSIVKYNYVYCKQYCSLYQLLLILKYFLWDITFKIEFCWVLAVLYYNG